MERLDLRERVRRFGPDVQRSALKRLTRLDAAESVDDLRAFRGNRLEKLRGDRQGQHSIRINDQLRICFVRTDAGPEDVEIDTALRLARFFGTSDRYWLNLQARYDLEVTKDALGDALAKVEPLRTAS